MTDDAVKEYLKREAFLRRIVGIMAGLGGTQDTIKMFPDILNGEFSDADRDRMLEIIDETIIQLQYLKELCTASYRQRKQSEE